MPTYDYECRACGARHEIFHSMTERPKRKCPECGAQRLERQIGVGAAVLFKGSGFYQTDYRSESYKRGEAAERPSDGACGGDPKSCAQGGGPCANGSAPASDAKKKAAPKKRR
jgi:putative FmdB family regulatory protein